MLSLAAGRQSKVGDTDIDIILSTVAAVAIL